MVWDMFQTPGTVTSHSGSDPQVLLVQAGPSLLLGCARAKPGRPGSQEVSLLLEKLMSGREFKPAVFLLRVGPLSGCPISSSPLNT